MVGKTRPYMAQIVQRKLYKDESTGFDIISNTQK
jgi:hypothetical protein